MSYENNFGCGLCGDTFGCESDLEHHVAIHIRKGQGGSPDYDTGDQCDSDNSGAVELLVNEEKEESPFKDIGHQSDCGDHQDRDDIDEETPVREKSEECPAEDHRDENDIDKWDVEWLTHGVKESPSEDIDVEGNSDNGDHVKTTQITEEEEVMSEDNSHENDGDADNDDDSDADTLPQEEEESLMEAIDDDDDEYLRDLKTQIKEEPPSEGIDNELYGSQYGPQINAHGYIRLDDSMGIGRPFQCSLCFKTFSRTRDIKGHMLTHTGERPYKCSLCDRAFFAQRNLKKHEKIHLGLKPHKCPYCSKPFLHPSDLAIHVRSHTGERPFDCYICSKSFTLRSNVYKHIKRYHNGFPRNPPEGWDEGFAKEVVKHVDDNVSFSNSNSLEESGSNKRSELDGNVVKTELGTDERTETDDGPEAKKTYICDLCGEVFQIFVCFFNHKKKIHHEYHCSLCPKRFREQYDLTVHSRTHTGEKPYLCQHCGKYYATKKSRKTHISRIHDRERAYQCSVCQKAFNAKGDMMCHMRIHTGEKPYPCPECGKAFTTSSLLRRHVRVVHTGEKPYRCSLCPKTFNCSYDVSLHMSVHTGEKPFPCAFCGKGFARNQSLINHYSKCAYVFDNIKEEVNEPQSDSEQPLF